MCCFSQPVKSVTNTKIFCRVGARGNQVVVYSMRLDADQDLAMILPVPVMPNSPENAVKFLDFSKYETFFDDVEKGFVVPRSSGAGRSAPFGGTKSAATTLAIKKVGSFDASFVPTVPDFDRLDERFRLDGDVWEKLPQFKDYGFVVFKLRKGASQVHPMAFAFPTRDRRHITFPTVHIHDGEVHKKAEFDHSLYCQSPSSEVATAWRESVFPALRFVKCSKAQETVRAKLHIYKKLMVGNLQNTDVVIGSA